MVNYNFSEMGKKGMESRWKKAHANVKISSKLSREKAAINAYLCGDGHILVREKGFHYQVRFFMDELFLAKRIVELFKKEFNVFPKVRKRKSHDFEVEIKNKPVCLHLLDLGKYGSFDWTIPKMGKNLNKEWLMCFFDSEGYVGHQGKGSIQLKSVNETGLRQVGILLEDFGIKNKVYGPYVPKNKNHSNYFFLQIRGVDNLKRYQKYINFYHPAKKSKLNLILDAGVGQW